MHDLFAHRQVNGGVKGDEREVSQIDPVNGLGQVWSSYQRRGNGWNVEFGGEKGELPRDICSMPSD
jgi:hypothetical protein